MNDMTDLISRLEREPPSRELDAEIWLAVTPGATRKKSSYVHKATGETCHLDETRRADGYLITVPHFTTSIDDAVSLVPQGWFWVATSEDNVSSLPYASVCENIEEGRIGQTYAKTPAMAITIAALKARNVT